MVHNGDGTIDESHNGMVAPGILAMADCLEPESANRNSIDLAVGYATALGADVTILDLRDLELPTYDPKREIAALPQGAYAFRQLLCAHDGLLIALPTREQDCPPLLLNAVAWSMCPAFGADATAAYTGKCAALVPAKSGEDVFGQYAGDVSASLSQLGVLIVPEALSGSGARRDAKSSGGENAARTLEDQMNRFVHTIRWAQARAADGFAVDDDGAP